uniref:Uncharacterized protein n=1 Tax=Anguilla anguilla TaxID=7936 RepID=A0A0E9PIE0_ANGAN
MLLIQFSPLYLSFILTGCGL